jgi:transposase
MEITTVGIDLAKTLFQVHGVNAHGTAAVKSTSARAGHGRS